MKDILVEFTDNKAILHKDPLVISSKKDLPYCFLNPDLSKVSGISPSYWVYNKELGIIPASIEEQKRRDEYFNNKPPENEISLSQTLDNMQKTLSSNLKEDINNIYGVIQEIKTILNKNKELTDCNKEQLEIRINSVFDCFSFFENNQKRIINDINKKFKNYKLAIIILFVISLMGLIL
jgi:hypothetical protein